MKKRLAPTLAFAASLIPMLFVQYGGHQGVQEVSGLMNLMNPFGIPSLIVFLLGVWIPLGGKKNRAVDNPPPVFFIGSPGCR